MSLFPLPNLVKRRFLLALLASSIVPFSSVKAFTEVDDETAFLATFTDPSEYTTETFSSLSNGEHSTFSMAFTHFTVSTTVTDGNGLWKSDTAGVPWLGTLAPNQALTISFGTEGVRAAGMFVSLTDLADAPQSGAFWVRINEGTEFELEIDLETDEHLYLGIQATDTLIKTLELRPADKTPEMDEDRWVTVAAVTVAPVPEPSTYLLLGGGALAFLALKRRQRASRG
jgi:hypothetical protein